MNAGIDPGRWKTGVAFEEAGELLFSAIVPTEERSALFQAFFDARWVLLNRWRMEGRLSAIEGRRPERIFIGDGTSSKDFSEAFPIPFETAAEYGTTLEAREIYWRLHRPAGIMKLLPTSLRTPPRNVDDLAAFAIAKRAEKLKER